MHPSLALFSESIPHFLPVCDHYAGSEKLMQKSLRLQADYHAQYGALFDITFDCEDGAQLGAHLVDELTHIDLINQLIQSPANQFQRVGVRLKDSEHPYFWEITENLLRNSSHRIAYLVIPKVKNAFLLQQTLSRLHALQHELCRDSREIPIHAIIESQSAVNDVMRIASLPQIECLSFGIMDFVSSYLGSIPDEAMVSPKQFSHPIVAQAKLDIAKACHTYGKIASHNVTTQFNDDVLLKNDVKLAFNDFGFQRFWSIHPNQIPVIIQAASFPFEKIEQAIHLLTKAQENAWGPIEWNGILHDRASYRYYWSLLKKAHALGIKLPHQALKFI